MKNISNNIINFQDKKLDYLYNTMNRAKKGNERILLQCEIFRYRSFLLRNNYIINKNPMNYNKQTVNQTRYF